MAILKSWKQETNYQRLFFAGFINGIGNRFTQVAIFSLLYDLTGSAMAIGMVLAIRMVPFLLLAPLAGVLADRFSKKILLICIDLIRIPLVLSLVFVEGEGGLWIVYLVTFLLAGGEAFYAPVRMSSIPSMVKQDRLIDINSLEQAMIGLVLVAGSSAGGVISHYLGLSLPFVLNGAAFLISAFILSKIRIPGRETMRREQNSLPVSKKVFYSSLAMITFIFIAITMPLANGIDNVLINVYALEVFGMGEIGVGLMYAALGLGFILSSFFSGLLKKGLLLLTVIFIIVEGFAHMLLSIVPVFPLALFVVIFITFAGGLSNICVDTVMMKVIPPSLRGRFFGFIQAISNTALGISMASAGFLLEVYNPRELSLIVGVSYISFTFFYSLLFIKLNLVQEKKRLLKKAT
ncbi:MFS transporter [Evansella sp. LMS18]|uniref:MFS transporter n=1 Tax=Evansella sp. LMS18 TaxID=2924033 RepID=UPI0020D05D25|nr:MFS transporter [Evansella sp. LMS18]UTR10756.1 MFS transporter [Evansella sp. LMS18]